MGKRNELAKRLSEKLEKNQAAALGATVKTEGGGDGPSAAATGERDKEDAEFATNEDDDPDKFAAFGKYLSLQKYLVF